MHGVKRRRQDGLPGKRRGTAQTPIASMMGRMNSGLERI